MPGANDYTTKQLILPKKGMFFLKLCTNDYIGEGNGDPLQYSCLENPVGGGA